MAARARRRPARDGDDDADRDDESEGSERDDTTRAVRTSLAGLSSYGSVGLQFAGTILAFGALGYWADSAFGTLPWFLIAGILIGSVGGFISLVKKVPAPKGSRAAKQRSGPPSDPEKPPRHR